MARFRTLVGLGLASTMMITAPVFASTATAKPAKTAVAAKTTTAATSKRAVRAHPAKAAHGNEKKGGY